MFRKTSSIRLCQNHAYLAEKSKMHEVVAMAKSAQLGVLAMTNPDAGATFELPKETKKISIDPEFSERKAISRARLEEK